MPRKIGSKLGFAAVVLLAAPMLASNFVLQKLGRNGFIDHDPATGENSFTFSRWSFAKRNP